MYYLQFRPACRPSRTAIGTSMRSSQRQRLLMTTVLVARTMPPLTPVNDTVSLTFTCPYVRRFFRTPGFRLIGTLTAPVAARADRRSLAPVRTTVPRMLTRTLSAALPFLGCLTILTTVRVGVSGPAVVGGAVFVTDVATLMIFATDGTPAASVTKSM